MEQTSLEFFARCLGGLESYLASELKRLGAQRVRPLGGGVAFFADPQQAERICLWSRVASRIFHVIGRVDAHNAEALYSGVAELPWERVLAPGARIAVRAHNTNAALRNTQFTALKVKDALCDAMTERSGFRPSVDTKCPDALIDVRIRDDRATVSFDLVGESLHRRSYFDAHDGDDAPLSCAYAAGLLEALGAHDVLRGESGFIAPVCDAGYAVVEAASIACDLAPGLHRLSWGFFGWGYHDEEVWDELLSSAEDDFEQGKQRELKRVRMESVAQEPNGDRVRFVGLSSSSPDIARSRYHARNAGLKALISFESLACIEIEDAVRRLARATHNRAPLVVCLVANPNHTQDDARAIAEQATFLKAVKASKQGSVFGAVTKESLRDRFGVDPAEHKVVGMGHTRMGLEIYRRPPVATNSIEVHDMTDGSTVKVEVNDVLAQQFSHRLSKVFKERRKWAARNDIYCYRLYDADLPEYNVAIDIYEGAAEFEGKRYVTVAEYQAPRDIDQAVARRRFEDVLAIVPVVVGVRPDHVFSKVRTRSKGGSQYAATGRRSYVITTQETGLLLEVDLGGYLDTGLFLDHRITREMIGSESEGQNVLNLFGYTGVASVHAAAGGARTTTTVDLSSTYLDWAARNFNMNGFSCGARSAHTLVKADVMTWIRDTRRRGVKYDLIFVDPPTFSNSKSMGKRTFNVQRDHVELLIGVSRLLEADGIGVFSCNLRTFKPDTETLAHYGVELEDITTKTIPTDFERNPRIHQCYLVRRVKPR